MRAIAKHAGVNHGLVHRHFGSKEGLLSAVVEHLREEASRGLSPTHDDETLASLLAGLASGQGDQRYFRLLAQASLDGVDIQELQPDFPVIDRMLDAAAREPGKLSPSARVSLLLASGLGLLLFSEYIADATGQTAEQWKQTREELLRFAALRLRPAPEP